MSTIVRTLFVLYCLQYSVLSSIQFGLYTGSNTNAGNENSPITVTLFYQTSIFQCKIIAAETSNSYYCDTSDVTQTLPCDPSTTLTYPSNIEYAIQFDNLDEDSVDIESVVIIDWDLQINVNINYFCFNNPHPALGHSDFQTDTHCLYAKYGGYHELRIAPYDALAAQPGYPHNLIQFNFDSEESNVTNVSSIPQCIPLGYACADPNTCDILNKYIFVSEKMNYSSAQRYCEVHYGSTLATVVSESDLNIALALRQYDYASVVYNSDVWIGLNDMLEEGVFQWDDGTSCDYVQNGVCASDPHWLQGNPNGSTESENCAAMSGTSVNGMFWVVHCGRMNAFLCNNPTLTSTNIPTKLPTLTPSYAPIVIIAVNLTDNIPEDIVNISSEICVFGSHHSFLDGTYSFMGWNEEYNGPVYYDSHEHKFLYPLALNAHIYQWQLHEDFNSIHSYSYCDALVSDINRFYAQKCTQWMTDIDQSEKDEFVPDPSMSVSECNQSQQHSITFEIETLWNSVMDTDGAIALTLYWEGAMYKCTIYPTHYDGDYSCNTLLNAIECDSSLADNPVEYGLQIDFFTDDEEHIQSDDFEIESITIKYMEGNVERDVHVMEYFCANIDNTECEDILSVANHTLVAFTYKHEENDAYLDTDALHVHIEHTQSLSQCVPNGFPEALGKYVLVTEKLSYANAMMYCNEVYNSTLATITSTNDLLNAVALRELNASNEDVWIGMNALDSNGELWQWIDGTDCDYVDSGNCNSDPHWSHGKPEEYASFAFCAEMSGIDVMGYFNDDLCAKENIFLCHTQITNEIPENINILESVCVFGAHHSYLDGTYEFVAWNNLVNGPIYYDEREHKYLYPAIVSGYVYEWQIHEDYLSEHRYSFCGMRAVIEGTDTVNTNRTNVERCQGWETDIDQNGFGFESDPFVTVGACNASLQDSVTFEIETKWENDGGAIELTLFWEGSTYKCTVYSSHDDGDYSCNTLLSAVKCDSSLTDNPVEYGLQIDVFGDAEEHSEVEEHFEIESITIKYMEGNVVRDVHVMEHFCANIDNTECEDILGVANHTLVALTYKHEENDAYLDTDALHVHIEHTQSLPQCVPDGYGLKGNKYILVTQPLSWTHAQSHCETHYNSTLATIHTDEELLSAVALRELTNSNEDVWIGLNSKNPNGFWEWVDGSLCEYSCAEDKLWAHHSPDGTKFAECAEMSGVDAHGYFNDDLCSGKHIFLCNYPTPEPTPSPTMKPTLHPTQETHPHHIGVINHMDMRDDRLDWVAFKLENVDLSCGGDITAVAISSDYPYPGHIWVPFTRNISDYYVFELDSEWSPLMSIQIVRKISGQFGNETLERQNVITSFTAGAHFDYGTNFCQTLDTKQEEINQLFFIIMCALVIFFGLLALSAIIDAQMCRKNDHFVPTAILTCLFQMLDMVSDVFFCIEVWHKWEAANEMHSAQEQTTQFLVICSLSVTFIVIPILISLYQLYYAATKIWLADNRIREWLRSYTPLLYFVSVFTGSSFSAIQIFNSNLYGLDVFYMGLHRKHILSFSTKKLHSIILFENLPQLILSGWYMGVLGGVSYISVAQIGFSLISIIVTVLTIILQTRIDKTQDYIYIAIDIKGQCIIDNATVCKNEIKWLKKHLARQVFGVNAKWVEIQKPFSGSVKGGLRLEVYLSFVLSGTGDKFKLLQNHYVIQIEKEKRPLAQAMMHHWDLECEPQINVHRCVFNASKMTQKSNKNVLVFSDINRGEKGGEQIQMGMTVDGSYKSSVQQPMDTDSSETEEDVIDTVVGENGASTHEKKPLKG